MAILWRPLLVRVFMALATLSPWAAHADAAAALRQHLESRYPATRFDRVTPVSVLPGLFEVAMGGNIIYTDKDGRYFLFGHLYDMARQIDLTEDALAALPVKPPGGFDTLPFSDAIKTTVRGKGLRRLVVFADPNCGYCKRFESELAKLDNLTVHTFLVPLLGPNSTETAARIMCAPDPATAWREYMTAATEPPPVRECAAARALDRNLALARAMGVRGIPTYLLADGTRGTGSLAAPALDSLLSR